MGRGAEHWFAQFIATGDPAALGRLFDLTAAELLRVATYLVGDAHAGEDLVQATFLVVIEDARSHAPGRPVMPWLLGILANRARELRKARARTPDPERVALPQPEQPADQAARTEFNVVLHRTLAQLPSPYGEVLRLHLDHGLSAKDIAAALQRPAGTVRTQIVRGMELLRAALPIGFVASALLVVTPGRGLAAVRQVVLAQVPAPAAGMVMAKGWFGGVLAMKQLAVLLGVAVVVGALWLAGAGSWIPGAAREEAPPAPRPVAASVTTPAAVAPAVAAPSPAVGARVATPTTGALHLDLQWEEDGSPAVGIDVRHWPATAAAGANPPVRSDARGAVALPPLPAGEHTVQVCATTVTVTVTVVAGQELQRTVRVRPRTRFEGVVVDSAGVPVAGAAIRTCVLAAATLTTTGGDGRFRWCGDWVGELWAEAEGLLPSRMQRVAEYAGTPAVLRFELGVRGVSLSGRVLDARGNPVAGAVVIVSVDEALQKPILPDGHPAWSVAPLLLTSDTGGRFATRSAAPGAHVLAAACRGHAPAVARVLVSEGGDPILLRLGAGATVRGVVRDAAGVPVHAHLSATHTESIHSMWPMDRVLDADARCSTDAEGRYELRNLWPTSVRLLCMPMQWGRSVEQVVALGEGQELEWNPALAAASSLAGRVLGPQDQPLAQWRVRAWPLRAEGVRVESDVRTDAQGRFAIPGIAAGNYLLTAMPAGSLGAARDLAWTTTQADTGPGEIVLRAPATLAEAGWFTGRVAGADGQPVASARLQLRPRLWTGAEQLEQAIDAEGTFRVGPLVPGEYSLGFRAVGCDWTTVQHTLPAGQTVDLGLVRLRRNGTVTVRVQTAAGDLVARPALLLRSAEGGRWDGFTPTATGALRAAVPADHYQLEAWGPDIMRCEQEVQVEPGTDAAITVTATPATPVRLRFAQPEPRAERWIDGLTVTVRDGSGVEVEQRLQLDAGRTFVWTRGFAPGSYRFTATLWHQGQSYGAEGEFRAGPAGTAVERAVEFSVRRER